MKEDDADYVFDQLEQEFPEDDKWPWDLLGLCERDLNDRDTKHSSY